jgi:hypothetical protein
VEGADADAGRNARHDRVAYETDITPVQFAQCVLDAHEMEAEKVSA